MAHITSQTSYKRVSLAFVAVVVCLSAFCPPASGETDCRIAVLKSWDLPEYNVALNEFTDVLIRYGLDCRTLILTVMDKTEGVESLKKEIRIFKPDIILTVGSRATEIAAENFKNTPIIFSMVLYPVASNFVKSMDHPGGNVTGAAIDIPLRRQFQLLSRIVPGLERVGVLYSPEETQPVIDEARRVAQSMGLNLIVEKIESESNVPEALSNLERQNIQAIWSVADGKVFTAQSTRYIIEQAVRREIPFMGPYNGFVRAGALVALTANYRDNGRQAAEIAIRVLNGANPATIPVATPQKVEMALNLRVASHIKVRIPESIVEQADQVFE